MVRPGATFWRWLFWLCVVAGVALALAPAPERKTPWFAHADKLQHTVSFAVLVGLGWRARLGPRWRLAVGLLLLGAVIEVLQSFTATRTAEWADLLADAIGIAAGLGVASWIERRSHRLPEEDRR